jgi:hypothetical protein
MEFLLSKPHATFFVALQRNHMEPQLKPVPRVMDRSAAGHRLPRRRLPPTRAQGSAQHLWLLALSMPADGRRSVCRHVDEFCRGVRDLADMAPLLMFAAMFGMLFVVSALRNSSWGVLAIFGFTFVSGVMLAPMRVNTPPA